MSGMIFAVSSNNRDSALDAPFEIDLESGLLKFPQLPLTLAPKQSLAVFLATDVGARAQEWGSNDGWQRYRLRQHLGDGGVLGIFLFFFNACLTKIRFGYLPESERDWSDWSKERELARADTYQREIVRHLGGEEGSLGASPTRDTTTKPRAPFCSSNMVNV